MKKALKTFHIDQKQKKLCNKHNELKPYQISFLHHDNFLQRHNKSRNFCSFAAVLLLAKIFISTVVITANVFQGCAITHHNLADSLAVIDGKGGIVSANFGQLTKVDTAREMWIIPQKKLQSCSFLSWRQ